MFLLKLTLIILSENSLSSCTISHVLIKAQPSPLQVLLKAMGHYGIFIPLKLSQNFFKNLDQLLNKVGKKISRYIYAI